MFKILILEDDLLFAQSLEDCLEDEGYKIHLAKDSETMIELSYMNNYDLYLLDINVPGISGLDLLKDLREAGDNTPSIFLSSYKDQETLKNAFINGADDFLRKPIDLEELFLRISSLLKRSGKRIESLVLKNGLSYDAQKSRLFLNERDLNVPIKVMHLFELCLENRKSIITKEMIVSKLWTLNEDYSEGSIRVYVNNLKKILGKESIINIKGIGYKIEF